jgi:hypothetical protein
MKAKGSCFARRNRTLLPSKNGAVGRNRTDTGLHPHAPQTCVSTSSTTTANFKKLLVVRSRRRNKGLRRRCCLTCCRRRALRQPRCAFRRRRSLRRGVSRSHGQHLSTLQHGCWRIGALFLGALFKGRLHLVACRVRKKNRKNQAKPQEHGRKNRRSLCQNIRSVLRPQKITGARESTADRTRYAPALIRLNKDQQAQENANDDKDKQQNSKNHINHTFRKF